MSAPILATKLFAPEPRPNSISRPRLIDQLNKGQHGKLTLVSAAAGFGKTTVVSQWIQSVQALKSTKVSWLSLGESDSDPVQFLTYFVAALQTIDPKIGMSVLSALQSPQPGPAEAILVGLVNEISRLSADFLLVLDDYHILDNPEIDQALIFLLENMPPPMRLVMISREDPSFPLPRMRVRGQLTEVREADLRFTVEEAADFFNASMGLTLTSEDILALEHRTEGWIAGLQLAALS
ncbi:MAG: LuxR family transcriptional regulator, partial [Chloroflexota bacterium]